MKIDRKNYPGIPEDFPIEVQEFALPGVQLKLNLVQQGDKLYAAGMSPHEVRDDYDAMTDLVRQVMAYCKGAPLKTTSEFDEMLARESQILTSQFHVRPAYVTWVMARVRAQLKEDGLNLVDPHHAAPPPDAKNQGT